MLTGATGNLGTHLLRAAPPDSEILAVAHHRSVPDRHTHHCDLADSEAVRELFNEYLPRLVIHTAYTQADADRNVLLATRNLADACAACGARLIVVSSDMVHDGESGPYDERSAASPIIPYGRAKLEADRHAQATVPDATIIRCSLIIGLQPLNTSSAWIVDNLRAGKPVSLFVDELRTPILAEDLAAQIWEIARLPRAAAAGVWHLASPEALSRFAIGLLLARHFSLSVASLTAARLADAPGPRPRDLRLSTARATGELHYRARPVSSVLGYPA